MDNKVIELVERFNKEFPNGDSLELAQYIYAHANDENPDGVIMMHPASNIETVTIRLTDYPVAMKNKLDELMEEGAFDSREEAERYLRQTPIVLEVYYEKGQGLFAVESDALDGGADICSPYTRKPLVEPEED